MPMSTSCSGSTVMGNTNLMSLIPAEGSSDCEQRESPGRFNRYLTVAKKGMK